MYSPVLTFQQLLTKATGYIEHECVDTMGVVKATVGVVDRCVVIKARFHGPFFLPYSLGTHDHIFLLFPTFYK